MLAQLTDALTVWLHWDLCFLVCQEKVRDWQQRFEARLGLKVKELTGATPRLAPCWLLAAHVSNTLTLCYVQLTRTVRTWLPLLKLTSYAPRQKSLVRSCLANLKTACRHMLC